MEQIVSRVDIACQPPAVFEFVTNAARWTRWHPATVSVSGAADRPLAQGETVDELIHAGPRRFSARWTVLECDPPRRWVIVTDSAQGAARITYELSGLDGACRFERVLEYESKRRPWKWFDGTLTRWLLMRQSEQALHNLKRVLESGRDRDATRSRCAQPAP